MVGTAGARAVGLAPPGVNYGNFMDTRLSWTFGDDDFLHPTGQLIPLSPTFSISDRPQYRLFFDSLNSRFAGRENLTHLVMYKKMPGFIDHLTTEAAVVLRFDLTQLAANNININQALYDAGSYIRLFYNTKESKPKEGFSAVFFPLDTDRFRLGYLYDISWGGTAASINQSIFPGIQGSSPGLKVQYDAKDFYVFGGFKTATIIQPEQILNPGGENDIEVTNVAETNYGFLGGFGVDATKNLRFDGGAGYFQQGKFNLDSVRGQPVYTYGVSGRVVVHQDMPVPQSVDFLLYKNDPNAPMIMFAPQKYDPHELAWSVSAEVDVLEQHLKIFDVSGATNDQAAYAGGAPGGRASDTGGSPRPASRAISTTSCATSRASSPSRRCRRTRRAIPRSLARSPRTTTFARSGSRRASARASSCRAPSRASSPTAAYRHRGPSSSARRGTSRSSPTTPTARPSTRLV